MIGSEEVRALAALVHSIGQDLRGQDPAKLVGALGEAGLLGFGIPEERGGSGGTIRLAALVAEELGASGVGPEVLHQLVGTHLVDALGDVGARTAALAGDQLVLACFADGPQAVVPCARAWDSAVLCTPAGIRALDRTSVSPAHDTWVAPDWHELRIAVPGEDGGWTPAPWARLTLVAATLRAAYSLGSARTLLTDTVTYVGLRRQFGSPVGTFQAVKHPLADAWMELHHARELLQAGLNASSGDATDLPLGVLASGRAAQRSAERCVQAMGGIGFTWEAPAHRHLKAVAALRHWPIPELQARAALCEALLTA